MKKFITILFFLVMIVSLAETKVEDKTIYKDIKKDHWAYKAVENLVYKGIFTVDSNFFNGEDSITRFDMAYYLSKVVNKLDDEKAGRDDLMVVEKLVEEFSKEMNSYGMDVGQYVNKIKTLEEKSVKNENEINKIRDNELKEIKEEIAKLRENNGNKEKETNTVSKEFIKGIQQEYVLRLKSEFLTNNSENIELEKNYNIEIGINGKNFSGKLKQENDEKLQLTVEGKKEIIPNLTIDFHTYGYSREKYSYYRNIEFENMYESSGVGLNFTELKKSGIKELSFAIEKEKLGKLKLVNKLDWIYLDFMGIYSEENKKYQYEASGKYGIFNNYFIDAGYASKDNLNFINASFEFDNKESFSIQVGYERADQRKEEEQLYNRFYGEIKYDVLKDAKLGVNYDYFDVVGGKYQNYDVSLKYKFYDIATLFSYNINQFEKSTTTNSTIILDLLEGKKEYREILAKAAYNKGNFNFNIGYINKALSDVQMNLSFFEIGYLMKNETKIYIKYLKTTDTYRDNLRDFEDNKYDIDFNDENILITKEEYEKGKITLGIEMNF